MSEQAWVLCDAATVPGHDGAHLSRLPATAMIERGAAVACGVFAGAGIALWVLWLLV